MIFTQDDSGTANRLFIVVVLLSLFSAIEDLGIEVSNNAAPLSPTGQLICAISSYVYLILRNANNAALLLFLLALTQTTFLLKAGWARILFVVPYAIILGMLAQNPLTHTAFTITEMGYARGPLMNAFYVIALIYGLVGLLYCIYSRRYLPMNRWIALLAIYVLVHISVMIQYFFPGSLLEMFCTALGELQITLSIMRPEERMDVDAGMLSWSSYQWDLKNIILSGERVQIIVFQMANALEIRNFLGDHKYNNYIFKIAEGIRSVEWKHRHRMEIYFERPGTIYLFTDPDEVQPEYIGDVLLTKIGEKISHYEDIGVRFDPRICVIRCPEDLKTAEDIISLGHKFSRIDRTSKIVFIASEIVQMDTFTIEARIEDILDRTIKEDHIEVHYQPIYDMRTGAFHSAEALARIDDPEYGMISPGIFIPAAEKLGFIIPIGDAVLEHVFRFISEHDLQALGLSYIEINLSVAQCMEKSLPEKIRRLQEKYGVDPSQVNLEITETTFSNISDIMMENVRELIKMGYSFALDDYGTGYSSIQRVNHIPLRLIKIDKSMLDEIASENGRRILEYTIRMMQSIGKKLVCEGAETKVAVDTLKEMGCDYIQGFYFSRPLPENRFTEFLNEQNGCAD